MKRQHNNKLSQCLTGHHLQRSFFMYIIQSLHTIIKTYFPYQIHKL